LVSGGAESSNGAAVRGAEARHVTWGGGCAGGDGRGRGSQG
jgi:hypothetical protein